MDDSELLKELLGCFFKTHDGHLEWAFPDGITIGDRLGGEIEKQLIEKGGFDRT